MMDGPPEFIYQTVSAANNGKSYTDFYIVCRIKYTQTYANDVSTFEVGIVADSSDFVYPLKITHADDLDVTFNSTEVFSAFGRTVSK